MFDKKTKRSSQTRTEGWRTTVSTSCAASVSGKRRNTVKFRAYYEDKKYFLTPTWSDENVFYFVTILPESAQPDKKTPNFYFVDAVLSMVETKKAEEKVIKEGIFVRSNTKLYAAAWQLAEKKEDTEKFKASVWIHHTMVFGMEGYKAQKEKSEEMPVDTELLYEQVQGQEEDDNPLMSCEEMMNCAQDAKIEDSYLLEAFDEKEEWSFFI